MLSLIHSVPQHNLSTEFCKYIREANRAWVGLHGWRGKKNTSKSTLRSQ